MRRFLTIAGAFLLLLLGIGAAENNLFGYAWRTIQLHTVGDVAPDDLLSPAAIFAAAKQASGTTTTILAVADMADCQTDTFLSKNFPTLQSWAGMTPTADPSVVGAALTASLADDWPTAPILAIGDLAYRRGTPSDFDDCFDPIWGGLHKRILPAPGNHEYYTPGAFAYYDYWADQAGPDRRGYYAIKGGNWLLLSLNSEIDSHPDSPQARWVDDTLAAATEPCVLGFFHKPAYSLQRREHSENAQMLFEQLQRAGATLVVNGHNHFYERTKPLNYVGQVQQDTGTVSFVVGTGGRGVSGQRAFLDTTANAIFGVLGMLRLELEDDTFSWWFHDAETREVLDQGSRTCNPLRTVSSL